MLKTVLVITTFLVPCAWSVTCLHDVVGDPGRAAEQPVAVRVGVFESRGVALAYGRSELPIGMKAKVDQIKAEHDQATKDGDKDRMQALEKKGRALQDEIHRQVFSGARIDEILALLKKDLPKIAKAANVSLIAADVLHSEPGVEVVDITLEMCAPFEPDEKTTKMIVEIAGKPLVPEWQLRDH